MEIFKTLLGRAVTNLPRFEHRVGLEGEKKERRGKKRQKRK